MAKKIGHLFTKTLILFVVFGGFYLDASVLFAAISLIVSPSAPWLEFQNTLAPMILVGGVSGVLVGLANELRPKDTGSRYSVPWYQIMTVAGVAIMFIVELASGLAIRSSTGNTMWSYNCPMNIMHQTTIAYMPMWFLMSIFAQWLDDMIRHVIYKEVWPGSFWNAIRRVLPF